MKSTVIHQDVLIGWKGDAAWRGGPMKSSPDPEACCICNKPALTRVGRIGYCKAHKAESQAATAALKGRSEFAPSLKRITRGAK